MTLCLSLKHIHFFTDIFKGPAGSVQKVLWLRDSEWAGKVLLHLAYGWRAV